MTMRYWRRCPKCGGVFLSTVAHDEEPRRAARCPWRKSHDSLTLIRAADAEVAAQDAALGPE